MMKQTRGERAFRSVNVILLLLLACLTLLPVLNIVAKSFSDSKHLNLGTVTLVPEGFNTKTYQVVMADRVFWQSYGNTVTYTVLATVVSLVLTTLFAYPLSRTRLPGRQWLITLVVITMFFAGGIIPNYLLVRALEMRNTLWAMIIPGAISTFNLLVMKTFFEGIPTDLEEAASIDGLSPWGVLVRIILPLSKPILATMALFYAVANWNAWFGAVLYLDNYQQYPVTIYLRNIIAGSMAQAGGDSDALTEVAANIKAVTVVLTALPIVCVYPFLQRYFVQGLLIGSIKG